MQVRPRARRLIHSVLVNHEYDLLEARVNMLKDVVDVFVLQVKQNIKSLIVFETYNCCIHIRKQKTIFSIIGVKFHNLWNHETTSFSRKVSERLVVRISRSGTK